MKKLLLALGTITAVAAPVAAVVACGSKEEHSGYGVLSNIKRDIEKHTTTTPDILLAVTIDLTDKALVDNINHVEVNMLNVMKINADTKFTIIWMDGKDRKTEVLETLAANKKITELNAANKLLNEIKINKLLNEINIHSGSFKPTP